MAGNTINQSYFLNRCEVINPRCYSGRGEMAIAIAACCLWFVALMLRFSYLDDRPWTAWETVIESLFIVLFSGIPVFFLATASGEKFAKNFLLPHQGLGFQVLSITTLLIYISLGKFGGFDPERFRWLDQMQSLVLRDQFWLNVFLFLLGCFAGLRVPFLLLQLRNPDRDSIQEKPKLEKPKSARGWMGMKQTQQLGFWILISCIYLILTQTSLIVANFQDANPEGYTIVGLYLVVCLIMYRLAIAGAEHRSLTRVANHLTWFDFLLILICISILYWFSTPYFRFGPFMGVDLFILVVIYGSKLGREHFGYSFQIRRSDLVYELKLLPLAVGVLASLSLSFQFIQLSRFQPSPQPLQVLVYFLLFSFRVGVFEEVLFRSGLMIFIRDQLAGTKLILPPRQLAWGSAWICAILFGLAHVGNQPGAESVLSVFDYKLVYAALATIASLFYCLAFAETNRLSGSVLIHGIVDTLAVVFFDSFLTVPF